jgi:murein DD-endopeptidase MepM/ murein hydrolase activator NlpD
MTRQLRCLHFARPPAALLALALALAACATPTSIPDGGNDFIWPLDVGVIVSTYGPKAGNRYNDGMNIAAPAGTPVRAAADGVVIYTGNELRSFGNLILIRHAAGWSSAYAHTETVRVKRNQKVGKGAIIAAVGNSGSVPCSQLHFELRREANAVDPLALLPKRPRAMTASTSSGGGETGCPSGQTERSGS